jgi:hypothetical protein
VAAVIFFVFGCCLCSKTLLRTKAAKALMLVSVGYINILQLVIDKF